VKVHDERPRTVRTLDGDVQREAGPALWANEKYKEALEAFHEGKAPAINVRNDAELGDLGTSPSAWAKARGSRSGATCAPGRRAGLLTVVGEGAVLGPRGEGDQTHRHSTPTTSLENQSARKAEAAPRRRINFFSAPRSVFADSM
jgi:hypothetical protein